MRLVLTSFKTPAHRFRAEPAHARPETKLISNEIEVGDHAVALAERAVIATVRIDLGAHLGSP